MDIFIIIKWLTNYSPNYNEAPSIISTMIAIPLNSGKIDGKAFIVDADTNKIIS
jgi:hypothetical protein